ncbi:MAG TPA: acyltransferase family protein [Ramlibacter sp.]|nr:acyltransferase family protein [Ramlibacter sp.]
MSPPEQRLHALDNLRALMMWLGIVLHGAENYVVTDTPIPWRDEHRTLVADFLLAFIHAFRMPVFFIIAGFFVAMLLESRGPAGTARHRVMRLGLPFAVFWLPLLIASGFSALLFIHLMVRGTWGIEPDLILPYLHKPDMPELTSGPNTMHMWFLWMLLWMSLATALLAHFVPAQFWRMPTRLLRRLAGSWWGPVVLTLPLVATDIGYVRGVMFPSGLFVPPLAEWVHQGLFFVVGLAMYGVRAEAFAFYERRWAAFAVAGLVTFFVAGGAIQRYEPLPFASAYGLTGWLWSFAWLGIGLKWMSSRNAVLGYLSESSYWVYLIHFPLTIAFGTLLYVMDLPGLAKMLLDIGATTIVCLATYHLFVRFTWVSVLLNGKRHFRAQGPAALTPA